MWRALESIRLGSVGQIWVTHCSASKNPIREGTPAELYRSDRISGFIDYCSRKSYAWTILRAKYELFARRALTIPLWCLFSRGLSEKARAEMLRELAAFTSDYHVGAEERERAWVV